MRTDGGTQLHNSCWDERSMKCCYCPRGGLITTLETLVSGNQPRRVQSETYPARKDLYTNLAARH